MKVYHGPSNLDPSRDIMVWVVFASTNRKTGDMIQVYLFDADTAPVEAIATGDDASVCGDCKLRPLLAKNTSRKACYVNKGWLRATWGAAKRAPVSPMAKAVTRIGLSGKAVRLGAYGDPVAAPFEVMADLAGCGAGHTGYTHQWNNPTALRRSVHSDRDWPSLLMASTDTVDELDRAIALGWRAFHVQQPGMSLDGPHLVTCPASAEAGNRTTCAKCLLCHGRKQRGPWKSITIAAH